MLIGSPDGSAEAHDDWGSTVLQRLVDDYVDPELNDRLAAGTWDGLDPVVFLQVLFPRGARPVVRINGEVEGDVQVVSNRAIEAGEDICIEDYKGLASYEPAAGDVDVPHVTALRHRDGWDVVLQLNYAHPDRFDFYRRGCDFATEAGNAFDAGRVEVALDNAYSAAELLAKAELLSCGPAVDYVVGSKTHPAVMKPYSLWARLGNTEQRFAVLLHRLSELRGGARYLRGQKELRDGESEELFATLDGLREHVRRVVERDFEERTARSFNVIAAREVRAGDIVASDAYTLVPPRP